MNKITNGRTPDIDGDVTPLYMRDPPPRPIPITSAQRRRLGLAMRSLPVFKAPPEKIKVKIVAVCIAIAVGLLIGTAAWSMSQWVR